MVYKSIIVFILVFVRMTAIFILTPLFNNKNIPSIAKIGFLFFLTYIILPIVLVKESLNIYYLNDLLKYVVIEFINGMAFGFVITIGISFIYIAGLLVDRNIGFAMVSVVNPQDDSQIPVSANLYFLLLMLIFFTANIHHILIEAVVKTYETIPIGTMFISYKMVYFYTEIFSETFVVGVQIAAPFILTILVANIILGLLSKAMPGMNVFLVGLPLKVFVGLITFFIVMQYYYDVFAEHLVEIIKYIERLAS